MEMENAKKILGIYIRITGWKNKKRIYFCYIFILFGKIRHQQVER